MKVWWLIISFTWGILNIWLLEGTAIGVREPDSQVWTFGQVMAMVILLAPIIGLTEGYFSSKSFYPFSDLSKIALT